MAGDSITNQSEGDKSVTVLQLELETTEPPSGSVSQVSTSRVAYFQGWIELMAAVKALAGSSRLEAGGAGLDGGLPAEGC